MKNLMSFCVLLSCLRGVSQEKLHILVTVDDIVTGSYNLSDSYLVIEKDTIALKYEMGRFEISNMDRLKKRGKQSKICLNFRYYATCPHPRSYNYNITLDSSLILQEYLLLKVYNFANYPNVFAKNIGYGYEYISPIGSETLPKNKRIKRNKCID